MMLCFTLGLPSRTAHAAAPNAHPANATVPASFFSQSLLTPENTPTSLSALKNQLLLVNFWASWCVPCVKEMPALSALQRKYAPLGVKFAGIAVDNTNNVAAFLKRVPVAYPVYVAGGSGTEIARQVGNHVGGLPYTVLIDANGRIRWSQLGPVNSAQLSQAIEQLTGIAQ